jgi:NADH-quinone oxidoreductase subunit L
MRDLLFLIPLVPFAGFLVLALAGGRLPRMAVALVGCGSVGIAALLALLIGYRFVTDPPEGHFFRQELGTWIEAGGVNAPFGLYLDALSLVMMLVVTVVGFLIHLYSSEFMEQEEGYSRFFAYMNLFVGFMLMLVLADNLLLLLLGWEGVGLCSYLLIGFWYKDPANGYAARKAFVVTRVGDTAMILGVFLLFYSFGTLDIREILNLAPRSWEPGSTTALAAAALLLGGALGKSAQLPLQTWLPDAMAGPTPVSALIHAATMVTAGVYLIARTHVLFELAPGVMRLVAAIGAATLMLAAFSALTQRDIKRVLAYSTISQIGYMFLALGVGAWSAAMFHFMTHAFFKALLFLGAGVVIQALHHEHDMFKMGGLRKELPLTFATFVIGAASLAALPLVTAGFYSKELILTSVWASGRGSPWLWGAGVLGAFLTAVYSSRMVFLAFFGEPHWSAISRRPGRRMLGVLAVLAMGSLFAGLLQTPHLLGNITVFSNFVEQALPAVRFTQEALWSETLLQTVATSAVLLGVFVAYVLHVRAPRWREAVAGSALGSGLDRLWLTGWAFDWFYDKAFVQPFIRLARLNRRDFVDRIFAGIALLMRASHHGLARTQTGYLRWYAMGIGAGTVVIIAIILYL